MVNQNNSISQGYSHIYKYNPDGRGYGDAKTTLTMLQLNHFINNKMFYDLKYSRTNNNYGSYLYEDYDSFKSFLKMVFIEGIIFCWRYII